MINLNQVEATNLTLEEDDLASNLSYEDAKKVVGAILGHHGVAIFDEVAEDIIEEFRTDA